MVNTVDPETELFEAERRVLEIQAKLHRWAIEEPGRRFDDLYNLVCDPAFLVVAWDRVRSNRGARSPGVDGWTAHAVRLTGREEAFLGCLRLSALTEFGSGDDLVIGRRWRVASCLMWTVVADRGAILSGCCRTWRTSPSTGSTRPAAG